jgi:glutamate-ammonia-ligase adenylyltransferase
MGGITDVEFLVQMLQLRHGAEHPEVVTPHLLEALDRLKKAGFLPQEDAHVLGEHYRFLRRLESRIRLVSPVARNRLPQEPTDLARIAHLMGFSSGQQLLAAYREVTADTRKRFNCYFGK